MAYCVVEPKHQSIYGCWDNTVCACAPLWPRQTCTPCLHLFMSVPPVPSLHSLWGMSRCVPTAVYTPSLPINSQRSLHNSTFYESMLCRMWLFMSFNVSYLAMQDELRSEHVIDCKRTQNWKHKAHTRTAQSIIQNYSWPPTNPDTNPNTNPDKKPNQF